MDRIVSRDGIVSLFQNKELKSNQQKDSDDFVSTA